MRIASIIAALTVAVALCVGGSAAAQNEEHAIVRTAEVSCDLPRCSRGDFEDRLLRLTGISPGDNVTTNRILAGAQLLFETGYFARVTPHVEARRDGSLDVRFEAEGAVLIRNVRIRSGLTPGRAIERRISLRSGNVWNDDPEEVERHRRAIVEMFERDGYFGTTVDFEVNEVSEFVVDIVVRVRRGDRLDIDTIYIRGHEHYTYDELRDMLLSEFSFLRSFTNREFTRATEAVIQEYRRQGFIQARFTESEASVDEEAHRVDLFLEIREGPRWEIDFIGNSVFSDDDLLESLSFFQTGFIDDQEIEHATREIRSLYETRGHFFASVRVQRRDLGDGRVSLRFRVTEGEPAEIRELRFEGLTAFDVSELRELMTTSEYDLFTPGGYLQRARLDNELDRIENLYREHGYLEAVVTRVVMVGADEGRALYLTIHIDEGRQTLVTGVRVEGDGDRPVGSRPASLQLRPGDPFAAQLLESDRERLRAPYVPEGYTTVAVNTRCSFDGAPLSECLVVGLPQTCRLHLARDVETACERVERGGFVVEECQRVDAAEECEIFEAAAPSRVEIVHDIEPGPSVRFGEVFVHGNFDTQAWVITNELHFLHQNRRRRGRVDTDIPFNTAAILRGQSNLRQLGIFDSVRIETLGPAPGDDRVHVVIRVEEASVHYLEWRVGVDARVGSADRLLTLSNELTWRDVNFRGRGEEMRVVGRFDFDILDSGRLNDGEFDAELRAIYFDPRYYLFGLLRRDRPWEGRLELAFEHNRLALPPLPQTREISLDARLRDSLRKFKGVFFELGFNLRRTLTLDQSTSGTSGEFEPALVLSITPRVTIERRDNPLNPSRGFFSEFSLEIADDFLGILDSEQFTKLSMRHSHFFRLGEHFVFGANIRLGFAVGGVLSGFKSSERVALPLSERFFLGGVSSLRGFGRDLLDTVGSDQIGGDVSINGNVELRYPFVRSVGLYGAVFVDVGQLAANVTDLRFDEFRPTAGFGLRLLVADIVPIVVDYAAVLGRRPGEDFGRLHFNVGYTF